jgi:hypothetical protein
MENGEIPKTMEKRNNGEERQWRKNYRDDKKKKQ